ncbi:CDP-alcohol phosphatidyltransferase family protein [Marinobacter confluentis]|uniref:CDP-alcohol phosphatidyltransferase family protein n=1 Tax=Marinobacter confluentis TaxID=1697557 RepID=A0A4Z1CJ92_9GAMM|nr:CDP-alcohol phosphatidyltransferase family protein [Marinobacter confluentis]TGN41492.1 CDP-alcohol phosphatidyltransferase family protein [Marinobacter confluentis]
MDSRTHRFHTSLMADLFLAALLLLAAAAGLGRVFDPAPLFYGLVIGLGAATGIGVCRFWPAGVDFGLANRVTLARGMLVLALVSLAPFLTNLTYSSSGNLLWLYVSLCLIALVLDGVDGKVARATGTETRFGARFDMELDALFILGLCLAVMALERAGVWVLALGLMRYGFVLAGAIWPVINGTLPESFRRKTVCVWQLVTLMVALLPITPDALAFWSLLLALALLCYSFATDLRWLYRAQEQNRNTDQ